MCTGDFKVCESAARRCIWLKRCWKYLPLLACAGLRSLYLFIGEPWAAVH